MELWIEIGIFFKSISLQAPSAPAWSCELKYPQKTRLYIKSCQLLRGAVNWNRSWESTFLVPEGQLLRGAVNWNYFVAKSMNMGLGQLLRGAVNWNPMEEYGVINDHCQLLRGAVNWNKKESITLFLTSRQLLRGAVNWNILFAYYCIYKILSAPAWSCELKSVFWRRL